MSFKIQNLLIVKWFAALCLACLPLTAHAATLFGVVTDRAAPVAAAAAQRYMATNPGDRIILRTPTQLMRASERELGQWLADADCVLAVAVFGDAARRLNQALKRDSACFVAFNGEQSLSLMTRYGQAGMQDFSVETLRELTGETASPAARAVAAAHPVARHWVVMRQRWLAGGEENIAALLGQLLHAQQAMPALQAEPSLLLRIEGQSQALGERKLSPGPVLVVLDHGNTDPTATDALCAESQRQGLRCVAVLARWGAASREAMERLSELIAPATPVALIVLQDFVVGAAEGREAVTQALTKLNIPALKALRLTERSALQWRLSPDGLPPDTVQYRVALPELQGIGQPVVVVAAGKTQRDHLTGIELRRPEVLPTEIKRLVSRAVRWQRLAQKANRDKRIAIVYYNHPPGRQNIGADNLDVPASLFDILHGLKKAGYSVGTLPDSPRALLDRMMAQGVNLPEDRAALRELALGVEGVSDRDYARWFAQLPARVRGEMRDGPLGRLHAEVLEAEAANERALGRKRVEVALKELHHLAEGANHPRRADAISGLRQLEQGYAGCLAEKPHHSCKRLTPLQQRVNALAIEGLRGWGAPPGKIMVEGERLLVPGLRFGNIFIGPQPPRGWEVEEELLHANTSVPPPHQYLAFYHWLRDQFRADAVVHLGRHSTYEFLPGKAVGLTSDDYPSLIASDVPGIYPYIVDGVGEGTQAKRRGLAVIVDHLTPPLAATPLYDQLLVLRQVVESFEASNSENLRAEAARTLREQVIALNLRAELEASMADVLKVRGIGFEAADDDLLAHEVGHYLTKLQEKFMPYGLHIFGRDWSRESLDLMLGSMRRGASVSAAVEKKLIDSPRLEMQGLLAGLAGAYVPPGKGNDPLRSHDALPTGRNFHSVDGDILPTRLGFRLGQTLAEKTLNEKVAGSEAVILWASDAVRDEGVMVAFTLSLMGATPVWNARGIVTDVQIIAQAARRDVLVTTSGLFRDLYPNLLRLIDRAGRLSLAASAQTLVTAQPELREALTAALASLGNASWGAQAVSDNQVAAEWLRRVEMLRAQGQTVSDAGRAAALRIFGDAPGAYGAGVNRLTERSGAWRERAEIGRVYLTRMGHAYGLDSEGEAAHAAFRNALTRVTRAYHGRASNLYGLLDNNDAFDYLGGLSLAVENVAGRVPEALVLQHADPGNVRVEPLATALLGELRGRYLNPAWIKPLMTHGYAGARTMGQEFLENLWGWQVTRPDLINNWAWDEVKQVYFEDKHKLGLPRYLEDGPNAHVKAHMLAIFMVAAEKGFWKTDAATIQRLGGELAQLVAKNGLPGSGHTSPKHPMWQWLQPQLNAADAQALGATLARANGQTVRASYAPSAPSTPAAGLAPTVLTAPTAPAPPTPRYFELRPVLASPSPSLGWLLFLLPLFFIGVLLGRRELNALR